MRKREERGRTHFAFNLKKIQVERTRGVVNARRAHAPAALFDRLQFAQKRFGHPFERYGRDSIHVVGPRRVDGRRAVEAADAQNVDSRERAHVVERRFQRFDGIAKVGAERNERLFHSADSALLRDERRRGRRRRFEVLVVPSGEAPCPSGEAFLRWFAAF